MIAWAAVTAFVTAVAVQATAWAPLVCYGVFVAGVGVTAALAWSWLVEEVE
jgi:hypothetical protein